MPLGLTIAAIAGGLKRAFRKPDKEGNMQDTGLMSFTRGLGRTGMGLGIGMGATKWKQAQQLEQQEKMNAIQLDQARQLQGLQLSGNKEMADYNQQLGMETWQQTASPEARVQQYKNAGLNVGLMYGGGSGGGGATIPSGGGVSGQSTQINPEVDAGMALQMAMNMEKGHADLQLTQAQEANINQDTKKKLAETEGQVLENVAQGYKNDMLQIDADIKEKSWGAAIDQALAARDTAVKQLEMLRRENKLSAATYEERVKAYEIDNLKKTMEIKFMENGIKVGQAQIEKWANEIVNDNKRTDFDTGFMAEAARGAEIIADVAGAFKPALRLNKDDKKVKNSPRKQ